MRLSPRENRDYWWKYDGWFGSPVKRANHLIETYFRHGEPRFKRFDTVEKIAESLSIDELQKRRELFVFGIVVRPRAALTMARIHLQLGDLEKARAFANFGLDNIGRATALRPALETIVDAT